MSYSDYFLFLFKSPFIYFYSYRNVQEIGNILSIFWKENENIDLLFAFCNTNCYKHSKEENNKCIWILTDINECEEDNGDCEFKCINTVGSYHCDCPEGMAQGEDKYTCKGKCHFK